jgi:hypothetical protein
MDCRFRSVLGPATQRLRLAKVPQRDIPLRASGEGAPDTRLLFRM